MSPNPFQGRDPRACRTCGCTERNCTQCVIRTGQPCWWVEQDLCSACVDPITAMRVLAKTAALGLVEHHALPGAITILLGREGHLHVGIATTDDPRVEPLVDLGRRLHLAIEQATGQRTVGDRPSAPRPSPTDRAACTHCGRDICAVSDTEEIKRHLTTCDQNPLVQELTRLRALAQIARGFTNGDLSRGALLHALDDVECTS